jgi:hypothetical protein
MYSKKKGTDLIEAKREQKNGRKAFTMQQMRAGLQEQS